jgi:hypothetical protein
MRIRKETNFETKWRFTKHGWGSLFPKPSVLSFNKKLSDPLTLMSNYILAQDQSKITDQNQNRIVHQ